MENGMNAEWRTRYDRAVEAARKAGDLAREYYETTFEVELKSDDSPVTIADRKAEQLIRSLISAAFPYDGFLGEEYGNQTGTSGFRWIIDPIDGTKSFVRHIPIWATLLGLEYQNEQIGGIVYIPVFGMTYRALRGAGAYMNERKIHVSNATQLSDSLICYSSINWFMKAGKEKTFLELAKRTSRQRGYGDFYGFVLVAEGAAELMVEHGVNPWDVASIKAIVEEAGGMFTDWDGIPTIYRPDVLASNGNVHAEALAILRRGESKE
jgi:histidinol-phosphatase